MGSASGNSLPRLAPNLVISLNSKVRPEALEFDRLCTIVANAHVQPLMAGYLSRFQAAFEWRRLCRQILMMTAP